MTTEVVPRHFAVKESVFPFHKFPGVDTILGPEMRSTGEVMGLADTLPDAFLKCLWGAGQTLPSEGLVFISVRDDDKQAACDLAYRLREIGFSIVATGGTQRALVLNGVEASVVNKVQQGSPHVVERIDSGDVALVINTTEGAKAIQDSRSLRRATLLAGIPYYTTIAGAAAAVSAIEARRESELTVCSLQEYHAR